MRVVPRSCQNLSQNHCLSHLESVPTVHIPSVMPPFSDECPLPPPCFLHLFNLFAVPFEPFLGRHDITPSISIQGVFEMCIIHVLFMGLFGDPCANQLYWTPQRLQQNPAHLNIAQNHFLKSGVLCFVGGNDTFMGLPRTIVPLKGIMRLFHLPSDAHTSAGLGHSPARFDAYGVELSFRRRPCSGPCRSHGRAVAVKKVFSSFCLAGAGKTIAEKSPNLRTPTDSKRDRHGCEGQASVTLVPCFPF